MRTLNNTEWGPGPQEQCCYRLALFDETSSQWESIRTYEDKLVKHVSNV